MVSRSKQVAADPEEVVDDPVPGRKMLQMRGRLEAAHLPLALSDRLMRHLGPIVRVLIGAVHHGRHHSSVDSRIAV